MAPKADEVAGSRTFRPANPSLAPLHQCVHLRCQSGHVRGHVLTALEDVTASLSLPNQGGQLTD